MWNLIRALLRAFAQRPRQRRQRRAEVCEARLAAGWRHVLACAQINQ